MTNGPPGRGLGKNTQPSTVSTTPGVVEDVSLSTSMSLDSDSDDVSLEALVYERLKAYADNLQGHYPEDMYRLIMPQLERPLIKVALELAGGEKKKAAEMLGIHRNTLRARLRELGLDKAPFVMAPGGKK